MIYADKRIAVLAIYIITPDLAGAALCLACLSPHHLFGFKRVSAAAQLSEEFNVAVVITNHVVSDPSGGAVFVADPKKPVGGHVLAHACTIRLSLRKGKGEQRLMKVVDAPNLRETLCWHVSLAPATMYCWCLRELIISTLAAIAAQPTCSTWSPRDRPPHSSAAHQFYPFGNATSGLRETL